MDPENKKMTVHQVAKLTGITNRTLHYYDEIGLLTPTAKTASKYRIYTDKDLVRLQEILLFKEMGFSLDEIKKLLKSSSYNREEALRKHLKILDLEKKRIDKLIELVNATLNGTSNCTFEAFSNQDLLEAQAQFRKEIIEKWGDTPEYQSFGQCITRLTPKEQFHKWDSLATQSQITFKQLSTYTTQSPALPEVQEIVKKWQNYISENFYPCSKQMLTYLGQLYLCDQRFKTYIDRFGNGTSTFFNQAIKHYCSNTQP